MARFREKKSGSSWEIVVLKNLSASGALFYCHKRIDVGSTLELRINFPLYQKSVIATVARTVRVDSQTHQALFRVAVEFTDIGKEERESIDRAAQDYYPDEPTN